MKYKIEEQDNEHFKIILNKEKDCFDLIFKKKSYDTSGELLGLFSWIHQLGVNCPKDKLRIGAEVETVSIKKSKIIV